MYPSWIGSAAAPGDGDENADSNLAVPAVTTSTAGDGDENADSNLAVPAVTTSTAGHWCFCSEQ